MVCSRKNSSRSIPALTFIIALVGVAGCGAGDEIGSQRYALAAKCSITVEGKGVKDMEGDYLPHVITCENGAADFEALKAQAVSARSYAYYVTRNGGSVKDGQSNQVYTCASKPKQRHYDAVKATAGQVLRYQQKVICAFFVAGAKPSDRVGCVAKSTDSDPTHTERYVTYNEGKSGNAITQSTLGLVSTGNIYNRGCQSQNGANCLSQAGRGYKDILRFYYGADIEIYQTTGSCVAPPLDQGVLPPDQGVLPPDQGVLPPDQGVLPPDQGVLPPDQGVLGGDHSVYPPFEAGTWPDRGVGQDMGLWGGARPTTLSGGCRVDASGVSLSHVGLTPLLVLLGLWAVAWGHHRRSKSRPGLAAKQEVVGAVDGDGSRV